MKNDKNEFLQELSWGCFTPSYPLGSSISFAYFTQNTHHFHSSVIPNSWHNILANLPRRDSQPPCYAILCFIWRIVCQHDVGKKCK